MYHSVFQAGNQGGRIKRLRRGGTRYAKPKSGINLRTVADAHSADRPQQQLTTVPFLVAHA